MRAPASSSSRSCIGVTATAHGDSHTARTRSSAGWSSPIRARRRAAARSRAEMELHQPTVVSLSWVPV